MRRMSFSMTTTAVRERRKTVTRRAVNTWKTLKKGDRLLAVDRCMGLKKGERQQVLGTIELVSVRVEPLDAITDEDVVAEGMPERMTARQFVELFRLHMGGLPSQEVRRIEFKYVGEGCAA